MCRHDACAFAVSIFGTGVVLGAGGRRDEHTLERIEVFAEITRVTHRDGVTLASFDGRGNRFAADGRFDDVIHVTHGEAVARGGLAFDFEIEEVTAGGALGENAACIGKIRKRFFDLHADVLDRPEVRTKNFDAKWCAKSGREHLRARLDRHPELISHAGRF